MTTGQIVIGAEEAARTLNVAASTLAKWRVSGFGPRFVKLGRRIGYRLADIEAWVEKNLLAHTAEQPASTAKAIQNPMSAVRVRLRPLR